MADDRWQRVKDIFGAALVLPPIARGAYLREACGGDDGLRQEVERLLAGQHAAGAFFSQSPELEETARRPSLFPGRSLGVYEIVSAIGAGGMGEVYKARDTRLDRLVAIKVLPGDFAGNPERARRFEREARTISRLNHPHICALYDVGQHDGSTFLVMEYLEGESVAERLKRGPLPLAQVIRCATEIAEALEEAHQQGIVHRDLKPANVVLTKQGAKLVDFGVAKLHARGVSADAPTTPASELTGEGVIVGTPQYMSPEQVRGLPVDHRSDLFSFGAILYELLSGRRAFKGNTAADVISAILSEQPPELTGSGRGLVALEHIVRRCLEKDRDKRFQSARDIAFALSEASATAVTRGSQAVATPRISKRNVLVAVAAGMVLLVVATVPLLRRRSPEPPPSITPSSTASIAVLPFTNLSPDKDQEYFSDGLSEELMGLLTKVKGLHVAGGRPPSRSRGRRRTSPRSVRSSKSRRSWRGACAGRGTACGSPRGSSTLSTAIRSGPKRTSGS